MVCGPASMFRCKDLTVPLANIFYGLHPPFGNSDGSGTGWGQFPAAATSVSDTDGSIISAIPSESVGHAESSIGSSAEYNPDLHEDLFPAQVSQPAVPQLADLPPELPAISTLPAHLQSLSPVVRAEAFKYFPWLFLQVFLWQAITHRPCKNNPSSKPTRS